MHTRNSMKSVIAQGATVVKAIEEALKKADMPKEFFVKILEEAQSGFLGFGSKKAKIALFFKKEVFASRGEGVLHQDSYEGLFNNQSLQKQIDNQQRDTTSKDIAPHVSQNQAPIAKKPQQNIQKPLEQKAQVAKEQPIKNQSHQVQPPRDHVNKPQGFQDRNSKDHAPRPNNFQSKDQRPARQPQRFQQRELKPVLLEINTENQEKKLETSVPRADRPQRPERRLQDIPQRQLPHPSSDESGEGRQSYRNRRRSRYYSPRQSGQGDGSKTSNSNNNNSNNNDSSNSQS
jgi:predicted RNA-binding protein Jag